HELLERLAAARAHSEQLFAQVRPDSLYERPIPERHRIVFYIGHLEAFDWTLLQDRALGPQALQPEFDRLFAFGIDPVDGGLPADQPQEWPAMADVRHYVERTRKTLDDDLTRLLSAGSATRLEFPISQLLHVAIEHRLMHAETLAYMLHQLPLDRKVRPQPRPELVTRPVMPSKVEIPPGRATLGLRRDGSVFGWDNEFEEHTVDVPAFAIDKYEVTNGEFKAFVAAGGYEARDLWTPEDWNWRTEHSMAHPGFWRGRGDAWFIRTMFDEIPLPLDWPVYVSHAEGSAYARWAGERLP